ncbi:MAG: hypothetical protein JO069_13570 [Verrucomicrobia bacterium]|nr:hypothetical protein [Verrucomicrobiota bacterium]
MSLTTIISGGQSGVDQGALEAGLIQRMDTGGFCPQNRCDERGLIPERYAARLQPVPRGGNLTRTLLNVALADATVLFYWREVHGGTAHTLRACLDYEKPFLLVDARLADRSTAAAAVVEFILRRSAVILNVAGPRMSDWADGFSFARDVMVEAIQRFRGATGP